MMKHRDVPLKIEKLSDEEDNEFLIRSKNETRLILNTIAQQGTRTALFYDGGHNFMLTTVLGADDEGVWLETISDQKANRQLMRSEEIIFVSSHNQAKVQFVAYQSERRIFNSTDVIYMPLPDNLLRIQRRDHYRQDTPVMTPPMCIVPVEQQANPGEHKEHEFALFDISGGGMGLVCDEHDSVLQPGKIYPDCRIRLPDNVTISTGIEVMNTFKSTLPTGKVRKRAGCRFVDLDRNMSIQLQRYITRLQQNSILLRK